MDVNQLVAFLEQHLGKAPTWQPEAEQDKEFNRWKKWSTERAMIDRIKNRYAQQTKVTAKDKSPHPTENVHTG
ncbi:MAG: hypothetical protein IIB73_04735 [Proteobacteria bacterium]|nr:hypothetical protein [Pseudomonadota bacterium]